MITHLLIAALIAVTNFIGDGVERRITFYWPGQDAWGTAVADQSLMRHGPLPDESWYWPLVAVSPDLLNDYPYGTWLYIEFEGFKRVSDRTAAWVHDTVDIRVRSRRMECFEARVWVILRGGQR